MKARAALPCKALAGHGTMSAIADIAFGYSRCTLRFATRSVGGISRNDFIGAAKVDARAD